MGSLISVQEVFAIAIQIETNAAAFYRKAAGQHAGEPVSTLLKLADMEDAHKQTFTRMRESLASPAQEAAKAERSMEGELFVAAIAEGYRLEGSPRLGATLTGKETLAQIVGMGLELEKQSILFYLGIKDVVRTAAGHEQIDAIIGEEKQHIVALAKMRKALSNA